MSAYTEPVLVEKLTKLSNSQQSVQTLSHWIMYHRKRHKQSVSIWEREIIKAPKDRKLTLLYLANDIIQTSRKKGLEFVKEFARVLPGVLLHVHREGDFDTKKSVMRVLDVWNERKVFTSHFVDEIKRAIRGEKPLTEQPDASPALPVDLPPPNMMMNASNPLVAAILAAEEASVADELVGEKVSAVRPALLSGALLDNVTNQGQLSDLAHELDDNLKSLEEFQKRLQNDLDRRSKLINLLASAIANEEQAIAKTAQRLQECGEKLELAEKVKTRMMALVHTLPADPTNNRTNNPAVNKSNNQSLAYAPEVIPVTPPYSPPHTPPDASHHQPIMASAPPPYHMPVPLPLAMQQPYVPPLTVPLMNVNYNNGFPPQQPQQGWHNMPYRPQ